MPLTESAKRYFFGKIEPQQLRDYSGPNNACLYEGYAAPGISTADYGWVIAVHSFDANGLDTGSKTKAGLSWDLRDLYVF